MSLTWRSSSTPGHVRHALVADDHVRVEALEELERLRPSRGGEHVVAAAEQRLQRGQDALFVVDEQQRAFLPLVSRPREACGSVAIGAASGRRRRRRRRLALLHSRKQARGIDRLGSMRCVGASSSGLAGAAEAMRRLASMPCAKGSRKFARCLEAVFAFLGQRLVRSPVELHRNLRIEIRRIGRALVDTCRMTSTLLPVNGLLPVSSS